MNATLVRYEAQPLCIGEGDELISIAIAAIAAIAMPGFQRSRKERHIEKIASEFDATGYVFPVVALFNDELICIDGQQRLAALELRGETSAAVLLIEGVKDRKRLAQIYLMINRDRKLLSAFEKYIGAVDAADRGTVQAKKITEQFGLHIGRAASRNGSVPAGAVVQIWSLGGGALLERVYRVRQESWNGEVESNEAKTLLGLARFLKRYDEKVDEQHLISELRKRHPASMLDAVYGRADMAKISYADYLRDLYNKGLRGKARL